MMASYQVVDLRFFLFVVMLACHAPAADPGDFHVSPDGNDRWSGTLAAPAADRTDGPFATIHRARDAVRAARAKRPGPVTVLVRGGVYRLRRPVVFEPGDSGTAAGPITYAAYPGEKPVLSGGRMIRGWKRGAGKTWTAVVPEVKAGKWYFRQLFVNGRRAMRARTPNRGYLRTEGPLPEIANPRAERKNPEAKMGFRFRAGDMKNRDNLEDVTVVTYQSWTAPVSWIASVDETKCEVRFTAPVCWPLGYWERKQRYHVENFAEALDSPGEWYLDRRSGRLTYWPRAGEDMARAAVVAPVLRKLVQFRGDPGAGRFVNHIRLRGLSLHHACWFVKDRGRADGQAAAWLEAAVFARGACHCSIENCEIAHVGEYGVYFERGCRYNTIRQCHIHDLGAGGARLGHMSSPATPDVAATHNVIDNCFLHDGGHVFRAGVGIWIGRSSHNRISHNEVCDFDYTGLSVGWSWGYAPSSAHHNVVEFNHVHRIGRGVLSDLGGIYTLGVSPGTVVRNNIFHDIYSYAYGGWGLYTDEGSSGIVMENNLVYDTKTGGFHQHYGKENTVCNNILAFSQEGQIQRTRQEAHISFTFERNIVLFDCGYLLSGAWGNRRYRMDRNVYWNLEDPEMAFAGHGLEVWREKGFDVHSIVADPLFFDAGKRDFRLKPGSPARKVGFKPIDVGRVGLYGDAGWTALPEKAVRSGWTFPPSPEPWFIEDGFEGTPVGERAREAVTTEENDQATIRVTGEEAASGRRSLKFVDRPGLKRAFNPHLYYRPNLRKGRVACRFALFLQPGAALYHEWRDSRRPYRVGPSLRIEPEGRVYAGGKLLMRIPSGEWVRFEILCGLGRKATGTHDLVITVKGKASEPFRDLPCGSRRFRTLAWCGFVAHHQARCAFCLDEVFLRTSR